MIMLSKPDKGQAPPLNYRAISLLNNLSNIFKNIRSEKIEI
jgi:hypothetical protein